jgi:polysaccharide export outer membrane protein
MLLMGCARAQFAGPASGLAPSDPASAATLQTLQQAKQPPVKLHAGDLLEVDVFGLKDMASKVRVGADGTASLQWAGSVLLKDLTVEEAEQIISGKLKEAGILKNPQVSILVVESPSQTITVSGEVKSPGVLPGYGERRLLEVLSAAGGLTPQASHSITIYRSGVTPNLTVVLGPDPKQSDVANIPIYAGDTVVVPQIGVIYLVGAFHNQGAFPLKGVTPLTLSQAVAIGGGMDYQGIWTDARLIRLNHGLREEIRYDVKKIIAGKQADPLLQGDDIIFVPTNSMRAAIKGGAAQTAFSLLYGLGYILKN